MAAESVYLKTFGNRGRGKPADTIEVLPGLGTSHERAKARRRALAILVDQNKENYRRLYKEELKALTALTTGERDDDAGTS